jgi:nicotinate-nucleotide pyrophosphorylase (carboxylating)
MRFATAAALRAVGLDPGDVAAIVRRGFAEDLGTAGDVTSLLTVPPDRMLTVRYVARRPGVAAGLPVLAATVEIGAGDRLRLEPQACDGDRLAAGAEIARLQGPARDVLRVERLSLNLLGRLSGIATQTRRWTDAVAGTRATVRDTRKTTPGLRDLEKYAVRCGGGTNHRRGLDDGVLVKDNHVAAAGGVTAALDAIAAAWDGAVGRVCARGPNGPAAVRTVQLEVDDLAELDAALAHPFFTRAPADGSRQLLCDNFSTEHLAEAVRRVRTRAPHVLIEASGGLTLQAAAEVAATGVDFLAVGALTHSAPVLDIGLDTCSEPEPRRDERLT